MNGTVDFNDVREMLEDCRKRQNELFSDFKERIKLMFDQQNEIRELTTAATSKAIEDAMKIAVSDHKRIDSLYKKVYIVGGVVLAITFLLNYKNIARLIFSL